MSLQFQLQPGQTDKAVLERQVDFVISAVALAFGQNRELLVCKTRRGGQSIVAARQIAIYLCRTVFGLNYTYLGSVFLRDRTTIAHSCEVVEQMRDDACIDRRLGELEDVLRSDLFHMNAMGDIGYDLTA